LFPIPRSCQNGFTLLEVLVAVMILGLSITAILQQFQVALRAGSKTQDVTRAVIHAKEKLEELKVDKELSESSESGSFEDRYEWETHIVPYTYAEEGDDESYENLKYETFQLRSIVKWHYGEREKQVELTTLKTIRKKKWK
jgi:type II secretion system protein I